MNLGSNTPCSPATGQALLHSPQVKQLWSLAISASDFNEPLYVKKVVDQTQVGQADNFLGSQSLGGDVHRAFTIAGTACPAHCAVCPGHLLDDTPHPWIYGRIHAHCLWGFMRSTILCSSIRIGTEPFYL
jgi:hypothetical protein